jgi:hypothetical protein
MSRSDVWPDQGAGSLAVVCFGHREGGVCRLSVSERGSLLDMDGFVWRDGRSCLGRERRWVQLYGFEGFVAGHGRVAEVYKDFEIRR